MPSFFEKPVADITVDDILKLKGYPEGLMFEIKQDLSGNKGQDKSWYNESKTCDQRDIGDSAVEAIFKELVAFANTEGGWLVVGLSETKDKPHRVDAPCPVPCCHALADKLKSKATDWIDPPLQGLIIRGIPENDATDNGFVVCRVPRSPIAPHRLDKKGFPKEAYRRISDESRPMKMREIQDMTISLLHNTERIEKDFQEAIIAYRKFTPKKQPAGVLAGYRITLVPVSGYLTLDRPYDYPQLFDIERYNKSYEIQLNNEKIICYKWYSDLRYGGCNPCAITPMLKGGYRVITATGNEHETIWIMEILNNGILRVALKSTQSNKPGLSMRWIFLDLAYAIISLHNLRLLAKNPEAEYLLEIEVRCDPFYDSRQEQTGACGFRLGVLTEEDGFKADWGFDPLVLPRYSITNRDSVSALFPAVANDFYNALGLRHVENVQFIFKENQLG